MSTDSLDRYVTNHVRWVRRGRLKLVPVKELEAWLEREAALPVGEERSNS